jgi:hypothetical protein
MNVRCMLAADGTSVRTSTAVPNLDIYWMVQLYLSTKFSTRVLNLVCVYTAVLNLSIH